jgi:hypothetical protein
MNIRNELIALGLAFGLFCTTPAFARPAQHFENGGFSHEDGAVANHVPTARGFGTTDHACPPPANADRDGWPADMILD